jgi:hypothetical protein
MFLNANIPRVCTKDEIVNLNAINVCFGQNINNNEEICNLCTLNCKEDLYHFLYKCPAYIPIRNEMSMYMNKPDSDSIVLTLDMNPETLRCLSNYLTKAIEIREEWIRTYN